MIFQSTSLSRGKTRTLASSNEVAVFQSTSLSRGKTIHATTSLYSGNLSIHFPLTREDYQGLSFPRWPLRLSIHFPLTREDHKTSNELTAQWTFNPLPSHEGRQDGTAYIYICLNLSIHFPLTREDFALVVATHLIISFNPLPSHEGRPAPGQFPDVRQIFQSTSLSRGKTVGRWLHPMKLLSFNPLPSHEGRLFMNS